MSFTDVVAGGVSGFLGSGGNPLGAALGAVGGVLSSREARKSEKKAAEQARAAAAAADPFGPYRGHFANQLLSLYGIQPEFKFEKQAQLDKLNEQLAAAIKKQTAATKQLSSFAAIVKKRKAGKAGVDPNADLRSQIAALESERTAAQTAYKNTPPPSMEEYLKTLPGYKAALEAGTAAINRAGSAMGSRLSGNLLTELMKYGSDLGSQTFNQEREALMGLSGATSGSPAAAGQIGYNTAMAPRTSKYEGVGELIGSISSLFPKTSTPSLITPTVQNTGMYIFPNGG